MLHTSSRLASFLALSSFALLAACNEVETGECGLVAFVPGDCGDAFCDLDDGLAVHATTDVYLNGSGDRSAEGLYIRTSSPWIAEVVAEDDSFSSPRVTIIGNSPGEVDLLAIDSWGYVVDYVTINVEAPDDIAVDVTGSSVNGPFAAAGTDDMYEITSGTTLDIQARPMHDGSYLMGKPEFSVIIDSDLALNVEPGDALSDGHFRVTVPSGEHDLVFATPSASRQVHFSVK